MAAFWPGRFGRINQNPYAGQKSTDAVGTPLEKNLKDGIARTTLWKRWVTNVGQISPPTVEK